MDTAKKQIVSSEEIKILVDSFYDKAKEDELLGPVFDKVLHDHWPKHLEKMYRFWGTVLIEEHSYNGSPFPPHAVLPIAEQHFERWLELFKETIHEHFEGEIAEEAIWRADKMATMFSAKMKYFAEHPNKLLF